MRHSTLRCTCISIMAACFCFLTVSCAWALTALSDDALEETHAATGIHMTVDNLVIDHTGHGVGFITHDNIDSLELSPGTYGSFGLGASEMSLFVDGTVELGATRYTFAEQPYFATDAWKKDDFEHVVNTCQIDKTPQFDSANRNVIHLEAMGGLGSPFLSVNSFEGELQGVYGTENYALGTLGVSQLQLIDMRAILYAMPEIPYDIAHPEGPFYCSGEGLAMEIGLRLSTDSIKIESAHDSTLTFLEMKGIHLRESFDRLDSQYDFLGSHTPNANIGEMYAQSTGDSGGYGPGDRDALLAAYHEMSATWGDVEVPTEPSVDNMYGGRFMIGNLRQVGFPDYVTGNNRIGFHENHANQLSDELKDDGWDDQEERPSDDLPDGYFFVEETEIVERPMTLSIKKRSRGESPDESECLVLNMPLHGSIRVAEVVGYNSGGDDDYLGGSSMGPLIVEGLRVKKLYLEFPGRNTTYELETAVNESLVDPNPHVYTYTSGRLAVAQDLPLGQKDYNPMGRGVAGFLNRMGPDPAPTSCPEPEKPMWDQYATRLGENVLNPDKTLKVDQSFWQIREPYPINSDWAIYRNPVN